MVQAAQLMVAPVGLPTMYTALPVSRCTVHHACRYSALRNF